LDSETETLVNIVLEVSRIRNVLRAESESWISRMCLYRNTELHKT